MCAFCSAGKGPQWPGCRHTFSASSRPSTRAFPTGRWLRRRTAIEALLAQAECEHLIFCGANRFGSSVQWLTQWPVTAEAVGVFTPGKRDALFVQHVNHAPLAAMLADKADVAWGGASCIGAALDVLEKRGAREDQVAFIGPLTAEQHAAVSAKFGAPKNLDRDYVRLRQVKSAEEIDWLRIGAVLHRSRHAGAARQSAPGRQRARARRHDRARPTSAHGAINRASTTSAPRRWRDPISPCRGSFIRRGSVQTGDVGRC